MIRVRDRLWLWSHEPGSHDEGWNLPAKSRITPVEAAFYMKIPNVIMVRYGAVPLLPDAQYTVPFRGVQHVVWSIVGAGGTHQAEETTRVLALPKDLPSMTGVMMDDFFKNTGDQESVGTLSLTDLRGLRGRLSGSGRRLDLWVVLYDHQLHLPVKDHLALSDKVTFWTWKAEDLRKLEESFSSMETLAPSCGKLLGCYMWDYGQKRRMPVESMKMQCEAGLRWLCEGRIEGIVFLASCICDLDLEAVEWTRNWIAEVGDRAI